MQSIQQEPENDRKLCLPAPCSIQNSHNYIRLVSRETKRDTTVCVINGWCPINDGGTLLIPLETNLKGTPEETPVVWTHSPRKLAATSRLGFAKDGSCRSQLPQLLQRAGKLGCGIYAFGFGALLQNGPGPRF